MRFAELPLPRWARGLDDNSGAIARMSIRSLRLMIMGPAFDAAAKPNRGRVLDGRGPRRPLRQV